MSAAPFGCAAVAGVDAFSAGPCSGECATDAVLDATSPVAEVSADRGIEFGSDAWTATWPEGPAGNGLPPEAAELDARSLDDAGAPDGGGDVPVDSQAAAPRDAGDAEGADGNAETDGGDAGRCVPATCAGCCTATGACVSGTANPACGTTGHACQDCTTNGQLCSAGACAATTCVVSACKNTCVPYFIPCCKVDSTCGCALLFPPGPCN